MLHAVPVDSTTLNWLLEREDPSVRYMAMRDLLGVPADNPDLLRARREAHASAPIKTILEKMEDEGYWVKPGPGYGPKYRGTVWSITLLAQLGGSVQQDKRIQKACTYLLDNALLPGGQFSANGLMSGVIDCLQGNLCTAMLDLGVDDPRLDPAFEWMARTVTGEGIAPMGDKQAKVRYYSGKCGPLFACGANNKLSCAWGGTKVMLAFSRLPVSRRTPLIEDAIHEGVDFFFGVDPATADYPNGWADKPSGNWWKFGFPIFYVTDLLQVAEAFVGLGYGHDSRLANTLRLICDKQDKDGLWALEYDYTGKTWFNFGTKSQPSKWVTLRALRVLDRASKNRVRH